MCVNISLEIHFAGVTLYTRMDIFVFSPVECEDMFCLSNVKEARQKVLHKEIDAEAKSRMFILFSNTRNEKRLFEDV